MMMMMSCKVLCILVLIPLFFAIPFAFLLLNPMLFDITTGVPHDHFSGIIVDKQFMLDGEMSVVATLLSTKDHHDDEFLQPYRNHCLRVLTFANAALLLPSTSVRPVYPNVNNIMAMTCAFYKVGLLWQQDDDNNNKDYIQTSIDTMEYYVRKEGIFHEEHIELARLMIQNQHKWTSFRYEKDKKKKKKDYDSSLSSSSSQQQQDEAIQDMVNAFRMAVWTDTTMGIIRFHLSAPLVEATYAKLPSLGFHSQLWRTNALSEIVRKGLVI